LNYYMEGWNHGVDPYPTDCNYTACPDDCFKNLRSRTDEAIELFKSRSRASTAKNMLVFSHYPTDYLWPSEDLMSGLRNGTGANGEPRHIEYFGGHRHNVDQDSCESIAPNNRWLVGGGGGWGTDGDQQGFVVGEISDDFSITTYPVLMNMPCGEADPMRESRPDVGECKCAWATPTACEGPSDGSRCHDLCCGSAQVRD
jgi:hypothetical protein